MKTAALSIFITFFLGVFAARLVAGCGGTPENGARRDPDPPLVLPPTVAGFFLLYIFGVKRPIGRFFIEYFSVKIAFSWGATVLAAVAVSFPLMYRSARGAFEQVDRDLVCAARTIGMSERAIFWRVVMPLAAPAWPAAASSRSRAGWANSARPP